MKLLMLAISTMLLLGLACGSEYPFGSKVTSSDSDFGNPLHLYGVPNPGPAFSIGYWETGVVAGFDSTDVVYLHQGNVGLVLANDVRLTPFGNLPAGSKVTPQDNDINSPLIAFQPPIPANIVWVNLYGGANYDLNDPVYIHRGPLPGIGAWPAITRTNDVRLTQAEGSEAGTKVFDSYPDASRLILSPSPLGWTPNPIAALAPGTGSIFPADPNRIEYVDINGNNQYDYPDIVYLRSINLAAAPAWGTVRVNDVRLSGPVI